MDIYEGNIDMYGRLFLVAKYVADMEDLLKCSVIITELIFQEK